jgi:hypothetical protein
MFIFILQVAGFVLLPAIFCVALWRSQEPDRFGWLLRAAYTGAFIAYILALGRWDVVGVYLRYPLILGYLVALLVSFAAARSQPWFASREFGPRGPTYLVSTAVMLFFGAALVWVARGHAYDEQAVELEFPLRDGWFYVGQGGNATILNYHNSLRSQRYALDIVGLNDLGMRARGLNATDLSSYAIYGVPVYSPCDGRVTAAVDEFPDLVPPKSDKNNVAGNHVVIACQGASILLAHLQAGSVAVTPGAEISVGAVVGRVGNSGNTSEPHLHVHAVRDGTGAILEGEGMPLLFDGRFLVRNETRVENSESS